MAINVLVVDDSAFFRRRVTEILNEHPDLVVIGDAANGQQAVDKTAELKPDVITMDIEMPVMDGITAVRKIMQLTPTPIIMFSSLTHEGAQSTLEALEAGALDFLPKKFEDIAKDKKEGSRLLQERVKAVGKRSGMMKTRRSSQTPNLKSSSHSLPQQRQPVSLSKKQPLTRKEVSHTHNVTRQVQSDKVSSSQTSRPSATSHTASGKRYKLLAIGTSTGGPVALQKILTQLPANFNLPIILVQHMPSAFTPAFATRLNSLSNITIKEAQSGDVLQPGVAYLAPGAQQMLIEGRSSHPVIRVMQDDSQRITYKPSVDLSFGSAAKIFGGDVLGVILTGMGADGREGCRMLKERGSKIWAQDEQSCVVYGMPQAVTVAGISEKNIALDDIAACILKETRNG